MTSYWFKIDPYVIPDMNVRALVLTTRHEEGNRAALQTFIKNIDGPDTVTTIQRTHEQYSNPSVLDHCDSWHIVDWDCGDWTVCIEVIE